MDRAEKIGLGTAVGGHLLLLGALSLGLLWSTERLISSRGISVSLVGEEADISTAPDATQEETAPAPDADAMDLPFDEPPPTSAATPVTKSLPQPITKSAPQKVIQKPVTKRTPAQPVRNPGNGKTQRGGIKSVEDLLKNGKSNQNGKETGTAATKTAAQYRSAASVAIGSEVRPFVPGCAPPTSDNSSLTVFVALKIGQAANLLSANIYEVRGETAANQAQVPQMKRCVLDSLRAASPYNLDLDGYDTWKDHRVQLKVNFK